MTALLYAPNRSAYDLERGCLRRGWVPARAFAQGLSDFRNDVLDLVFHVHGVELRLLALVGAIDSYLAGVTELAVVAKLSVVTGLFDPRGLQLFTLDGGHSCTQIHGVPYPRGSGSESRGCGEVGCSMARCRIGCELLIGRDRVNLARSIAIVRAFWEAMFDLA